LLYVEKNGEIFFISVDIKSEGSTYGVGYSSRMKFKVTVVDKMYGKIIKESKKFHNRVF